MEINNFYNSLLEKNQGDLFNLFANSIFDFYFTVKKFMKSKICRSIDSSYSSFHNIAPKLIFSYLLEENPEIKKHLGKVKINPEAARWLGYFYRKWHNTTKEFSSRIVSQLNPKEGIKNYFVLHQTNEKQAIELCKRSYNIRRNAHRKYELKKNVIDYNKFNETAFLSLAKNILVKLFDTNSFKTLEINYSRNIYYDLISSDKTVGVVFKNMTDFSEYNLKRVFNKENIEMMFSKYTAEISIIFILIRNKTDEHILTKILSNFVNYYLQQRNKFDIIFVFNNNVLYQIDKKFQLTKFNVGVALSKVFSNQNNI